VLLRRVLLSRSRNGLPQGRYVARRPHLGRAVVARRSRMPRAGAGNLTTTAPVSPRGHCERGCQDGHDAEDWLQAERELEAAASSPAA
jgi:hypothetical protein